VCSILVGVGKLLLGPRPLGVGLICLSAVCLYITIRRIRTDCRKDVSDAVAAKLDEAGKDKKIINQDLA